MGRPVGTEPARHTSIPLCCSPSWSSPFSGPGSSDTLPTKVASCGRLPSTTSQFGRPRRPVRRAALCANVVRPAVVRPAPRPSHWTSRPQLSRLPRRHRRRPRRRSSPVRCHRSCRPRHRPPALVRRGQPRPGPTPAGYVATDVGCASGTSAGALDAFFRDRIGPVLGHDYQHVYDLGGDRRLWLFQDTFVDQGGTATRLDRAAFVHNTAMLQEGRASRYSIAERRPRRHPSSKAGERRLSRWFWPLGGETIDGICTCSGPRCPRPLTPCSRRPRLGWCVPGWRRTTRVIWPRSTFLAGAGLRRPADLRLRRRQRRLAQLPVRQLVRSEPRPAGRLLGLPVHGHHDVAGAGAGAGWPRRSTGRARAGAGTEPTRDRSASASTPRTRCSHGSSAASGSP